MHERLITMYTGTNITTKIVATSPNAVIGSYWNPSQNGTTRPTISWSQTATLGERNRGWRLASALGSSRTRPMENHVRVAAFEPALEFAMVEFTIAKNTRIHAPPQTARPSPSHPVPVAKLTIFSGPVNTVAAYVVRT